MKSKNDAIQWVYDQDENDQIDQDDLELAFKILYDRSPDDEDRQNGLWSLCCCMTPNCGTRPVQLIDI